MDQKIFLIVMTLSLGILILIGGMHSFLIHSIREVLAFPPENNTPLITSNQPNTESTNASKVINHSPTAQNISITSNEINSPITIVLKGSDPDGDKINFTLLTNPIHGSISSFKPSVGVLTYNPTGLGYGDSFAFRLADDKGGVSNIGIVKISFAGK